MNRNITSVIIKLFVLSLVAGLIMSFFDIKPETLLEDLGETAVRIFNALVGAIEWSIPYVLIGAVVVVPLWILLSGMDYLRKRRK